MQTTTTPETPTPTPAALPRLEVAELVIRGPDGARTEITAHGITVRDAQGRARVEVGHQGGGLYAVTLLEPDPTEPEDIRVRAAMEIDGFGLVALWVNNGDFDQRHTVGAEALPLEDYGDPNEHTMLSLHGRNGGTARFFDDERARLRRVK